MSAANPPPATRGFRAPRLPDKTATGATAATATSAHAAAPSATAASAPASATPAAVAPTSSSSSGATVSQLRSNPFLAADRAAASGGGTSGGGSGHHTHSSSSSSLKSNPFLAADKKQAAAGPPKATAAASAPSAAKLAAVTPAPAAPAPARPPPAVATASLRSNPFLAADRNAATAPKSAPALAAAAAPVSPAATVKQPAPSAVPPAASSAATKATASAPAPAPASASKPAAVVATSPAPAPSSSPIVSAPVAGSSAVSPPSTAAVSSPSSSSSPTVIHETDPDVWAMSSLPVVTRSPSTGSRTCHGCKGPILDAQFVAAAERFFHLQHFNCSLCSAALDQSSFQSAADGELLLCVSCAGQCKSCFVCTQLVVAAKGQPQVVSLNASAGTVCHLACFACASCAKPLKGVPMWTSQPTHQLYCESCAQPFMPSGFDCVACGESICGRVLLALENHWHPACFCCANSSCLAPLESVPFLVDESSNSVYCRPHFESLFSPKCSVCNLPLPSSSEAGAEGGAEAAAVALANAPHIRMHASCMRCVTCHTLLHPSAFHQDPDDLGALYCTQHFEESFAERCDVCAKPIAGAAPLRVQDKIMHQSCFACAECGRSLATCAYAEKQGKLVCDKHAAVAAVVAPAPAAAAKSAPAPVSAQPQPLAVSQQSKTASSAAPAAPSSASSTPPAPASAATAASPSAPAPAVAAAPAARSTSSIQDRIRALQAQQQQPSAASTAAATAPPARGATPAQKAATAPTAAAAAAPCVASPKAAAPATSPAPCSPALAAVPESPASAVAAPTPAAAAVPVTPSTMAVAAEPSVEPMPAANAASPQIADSDDDDDCEPPPPPPPMVAASVLPPTPESSSVAPVVAVAAVGAIGVAAAVAATPSEPASNLTSSAGAAPASPSDRPASPAPVEAAPVAVTAQPDAAAVTAPSDSSAATSATTSTVAVVDDGPGIEIEEGVPIESLTRRRGVASVNKTGAPPPFKPPPPLGSMSRLATPPPAAAAAAPVAAPAPAAPYVVQLVNGDIPPSALGPFISKGIEAAVLQSTLHRSKSTASDKKSGGDFARKDLYALQHGGVSFTMLDYAPQTFARIRKHFGISQASYLKSLVGAVAEAAAAGAGASSVSASTPSAVPESASAPCAIRGGAVGDGKSGMLFFYSTDGRYVLKTVKRDEVSFFRRILRAYTEHLTIHHPHTLLPRFFSMHKVMYTTRAFTAAQSSDGSSGPGGESRTFRLICMNNLFDVAAPPVDDISIAHRFDLKGSTRNRRIDPARIKPGRVLLDLNFQEQGFRLHLGERQKAVFMAQLRTDADFLRRVNAMDHSLLLGIHLDDDEALERWGRRAVPVDAAAIQGPLIHDTQRLTADAGLVSVWQRHRGGVRGFESAPASAAASPATAAATAVASAAPIPRREVYFLGIIDILQEFNTAKAIESAYKRVRFNKSAISAIESRGYNERFVSYLDSVIV